MKKHTIHILILIVSILSVITVIVPQIGSAATIVPGTTKLESNPNDSTTFPTRSGTGFPNPDPYSTYNTLMGNESTSPGGGEIDTHSSSQVNAYLQYYSEVLTIGSSHSGESMTYMWDIIGQIYGQFGGSASITLISELQVQGSGGSWSTVSGSSTSSFWGTTNGNVNVVGGSSGCDHQNYCVQTTSSTFTLNANTNYRVHFEAKFTLQSDIFGFNDPHCDFFFDAPGNPPTLNYVAPLYAFFN